MLVWLPWRWAWTVRVQPIYAAYVSCTEMVDAEMALARVTEKIDVVVAECVGLQNVAAECVGLPDAMLTNDALVGVSGAVATAPIRIAKIERTGP